ncbi:hypothetical protein RAS1_36140 [Phycisphaerae bacterium RAS1]|nr:hypothetical protein RAS1_36140 [Phycisphaerae bacterium RAS1]
MRYERTLAAVLVGALLSFGGAAAARADDKKPDDKKPESKPAPAGATEKKPDAAPGMMDKKQIAAMMAMKGQPGSEHKMLDALAGSFDVEIKMSMMPGTPPLVAHAVFEGQWVLGKRFIQTMSKPAAGEELKIESISYFGFDQRTEKYFWWGIDNTDTYSVFAEGEYDETSKTVTLFGENLEQGVGKMKFKVVLKLESADKHTMAVMFQAPEAMRATVPAGALDKDGWFAIMESVATRKKQ